MSVVLTAMLHMTIELNALQILVESRRFYFREPQVFHWFNFASYFRGENWNVLCVDAAAMAMLLSRGTSLEDPSSFLLLNTLHRNSILKYDMELRVMNLSSTDNYSDIDNFEFGNSWRSSDILSFLVACEFRITSWTLLGFDGLPLTSDPCRIPFLFRALCDLGLVSDPRTRAS